MKITDVNRSELTSGMRQYYDIKIKHLDKIVLFQLGDFYELFFEDAVEVANLLELTLTKKGAGLKEKVPMAGVPLSTLDVTVKRLMDFNKTVAIVKQDEANSIGKKLVERNLARIVTPGTFFDATSNENNFIATVAKSEKIDVAYGDLATGEMFYVNFFNKDEAFNYLLALGIKEIIDPKAVFEAYSEVACSLGVQINSSFEFLPNNTKTATAVYYLIEYLRFVTCDKIDHLNEVTEIKLNDYMQLGLQTQKQLELVTTLKENEYSGSLYWYLNQTNTAMGRRSLKRMLMQPLLNESEIDRRHNLVELFVKMSFNSEQISDILKQIYDFERLIGRLSDEQISPKEMDQLRRSINKIPDIKQILLAYNSQITNELSDEIDELFDVYTLIDKQLTDEPPMQIKDGNIIKAGFDKEVDRLRDIKANSNQWLTDFEIKQREETGIKNLKVKYNKIFGYFIEVTNSFLNLVPDEYIRKQTMANCERFITEELKTAENDILNAADRLNILELELYSQLRVELKPFITRLQTVAHHIAFIDVICAFARVSNENNLIRPVFNNDNQIKIKNGWHPIVKKMTSNFIDNDITMDSDEQIMLITGPNMSGKSTYMRQLVVTIIMAQIGCFVPAKEANLKLFDRIFTRIGASDDLSGGKSTFMVEMAETAEALNNATTDSLLIFDELGRGTSTYDGVALATAILEYIHDNLSVKTMFSTHYHELVDMQSDLKYLKNVHVKAKKEDGKLVFYHKVLPGGVEKSYGIEVAKLANLPKYVTTRASVVISELENMHNKNETHVPKSVKANDLMLNNTREQLEFFKLEPSVEKEIVIKEVDSKAYENLKAQIVDLDLMNMSPIDVMNYLNSLQKDLKK